MSDHTLYGQHSRLTLTLVGIACLFAGLLLGIFAIPPDALPIHQRVVVGLATGFWSAFCIFGWRVLFSEPEQSSTDD